jgi:hypothetical protein
MLTLPDGSWKIEVFSSIAHAMLFAKENNYEVFNGSQR